MGDSHQSSRPQAGIMVEWLFRPVFPPPSFESSTTSFPHQRVTVARAKVIMERGYLGAGAICRACFEPFGRLEDLKVPYLIQCGHTMCLNCLNEGDPCCRICGVEYERQIVSRLRDLGGDAPSQAFMYNDEQMGNWLQEAMSEFRNLSTSSVLLKIAIDSKSSAQITQSQLTGELCNQINTLNIENNYLHHQIQLINSERGYVRDHISELMRQDPNYRLMESEVIDSRRELNDLKEKLHQLRHAFQTDLFIPPLPDSYTPEIQIHPASRSPSPVALSVSPLRGNSIDSSTSPCPLELQRTQDALGIQTSEPVSNVPDLAPSSASDSTGYSSAEYDPNSDEEDQQGENDRERRVERRNRRRRETFHTYGTQNDVGTSDTLDESSAIRQPRAVYPGTPGAAQSSTVRFHIPEAEGYIESNSFDTAPISPAFTDADSIMTSSIRLLRTPEHEDNRTRFDLFSPALTSSPSLREESVPYQEEDMFSASNPPSPVSSFLHMNDLLLNQDNDDTITLPASSTQGVHTASSDNLPGSTYTGPSPSSDHCRPAIADNTPSRTRSGGGPSTVSRAIVRSRSFPTLRRPSSSRNLAVPSTNTDFTVLTSNRRLGRMGAVLVEVIIHLIADPNFSLDWDRIEASLREEIRQGGRWDSSGRMVDADTLTLPSSPVRSSSNSQSSPSHRRQSPSTPPELPQRSWTPS